MSQATREDIERVLKSLLTEIAPRDDKLYKYERTFMKRCLSVCAFEKTCSEPKCNIVQNFVVRVKREPEATLDVNGF